MMASTTVEETAPGTKPASVVEAKLYGFQGAPPSFSAELMLRHKGIRYRRVNLIWFRAGKTLPAKGFPGRTAPALVLDGRRVQTNRAIARALDEVIPDPPLLPDDPSERWDVEAVETFGDEVLQHATRRMFLWSSTHDPDSVTPHPAIGRMPFPRNAWVRKRVMRRPFEHYGITEAVVREDFKALRAWLDKLDAFVADGVLNAPELTAADFEIAPLIAALLGIADLGAEVGRHPVVALVDRVLPAGASGRNSRVRGDAGAMVEPSG
jgi:glutathione S-transferase